MADAEVTPEQQAAAREFLVDEAHDERAAAKRAAALDGDTTPSTPADPAVEKANAEKADAEAKVKGAMQVFGLVGWSVLDGLVVRFAGPELRLTQEEKITLADATVPVLDKYVPDWLAKLTDTPEGRLMLVAGGIYAGKAFLMFAAPPPPPAQQQAPSAPAAQPEVKP